MGIVINQLGGNGFTKNQLNEILKGKEAGVDISVYAAKRRNIWSAKDLKDLRMGKHT